MGGVGRNLISARFFVTIGHFTALLLCFQIIGEFGSLCLHRPAHVVHLQPATSGYLTPPSTPPWLDTQPHLFHRPIPSLAPHSTTLHLPLLPGSTLNHIYSTSQHDTHTRTSLISHFSSLFTHHSSPISHLLLSINHYSSSFIVHSIATENNVNKSLGDNASATAKDDALRSSQVFDLYI